MNNDQRNDLAPLRPPYDLPRTTAVEHYRGTESSNFESEELSLFDYLSILRKRALLIGGTTLFFITIAALYCYLSVPLYTATATLEMKGYAPVLAGVQSETLFGNDTRRIEYAKTTVAKLKLEGLADEILSKDGLSEEIRTYRTERQGFISRAMRALFKLIGENAPQLAISSDDHFLHKPSDLRAYLGLIDITPVHETNLVVISATTTSPALSQRIANAHATGFIDHLQRERQQSLESSLQLLRRQGAELKTRVTAAEQALTDYAERNKLLSLSGSEASGMVARQIEGLATMLADATGRRVKSESILNEIQSHNADESSALDDETTRQLRMTLKQAEMEYAAMGQRVTPAFPAMMELRAKIDNIRKMLAAEKRRLTRGLEIQYETDKTTEEKLRARIEEEKGSAQDVSQRLIQYNVLSKEADSLRELYQSVLRQVKEIEVSSASSTSNVFVTDFASRPSDPSAPKSGLVLTLFTLLGLGSGLIIAFVLESFDGSLKTSDEVRRSLDLPILGAVPEFTGNVLKQSAKANPSKRSLLWSRGNGNKSDIIALPLASVESSPAPQNPPKRIVTLQSPGDVVSEALRTIRAGILLSSADNPPRVVLFTSATKGEGKTTIVSNLAATLAQADHKTLVIDCDLRVRELSSLFHDDRNPASRGLSDLLTGHASLDQVVYRTGVQGLDILPAGSSAPNPAELLGSRSMASLIRDLARRYDYIVMDTPPVLPVADTLMLSRLADSVVLVVRSRSTERKLAQEARRRLLRVSARILGVVLNDVDPKRSDEYGIHVYKGYVDTRRSENL